MIQLGSKVKDKITGFTGIVTGIVTYITGCSQALIAPPVDKQGKRPEGEWIDLQRLEVDKKFKRIVLHNAPAFDNGFDAEPPKR
jgi:hypothetical protein